MFAFIFVLLYNGLDWCFVIFYKYVKALKNEQT